MRHLKYFVPQLPLFTWIPSEQPNQKKTLKLALKKYYCDKVLGDYTVYQVKESMFTEKLMYEA